MKWNSQLYDNEHKFVSAYGENLIELLNPKAGEFILDLGCGTGDLAEAISKYDAKVVGLDNSPEMIQQAMQKYPSIQFKVGSATDFNFPEKVDAIFSNATLHWVLDYKAAITSIYANLKKGGRLVAEFGGKGNVDSIVQAVKKALNNNGFTVNAKKDVWYFPSLSEYTSHLESLGFRVTYASHFDRPTILKTEQGLKNWLRMFGGHYFQAIPSDRLEIILQDIEDMLRATNYKEGVWYADYVRLRVAAIKE